MKLSHLGSVLTLSAGALAGAEGCNASESNITASTPQQAAAPRDNSLNPIVPHDEMADIFTPSTALRFAPTETVDDLMEAGSICVASGSALKTFMEDLKKLDAEPSCRTIQTVEVLHEEHLSLCRVFAHATVSASEPVEEPEPLQKMREVQSLIRFIIPELQETVDMLHENYPHCFPTPSVIFQ